VIGKFFFFFFFFFFTPWFGGLIIGDLEVI